MCNEKMITDNLNLVHYLIRRHARVNDSNYEDYFQAGCVGLCLAAERFDESKGIQFSTFAGSYIIGYIKQHYEHFDCSSLKVPRHIVFGDGSKPLPSCDSLQDAVGDANSTDKSMHLEDVIPDSDDLIGDLIADIGFAEVIRDTLTETEKKVLRLLISGNRQKVIAEKIQHSQADVSRVIKRIKVKLYKEQRDGT